MVSTFGLTRSKGRVSHPGKSASSSSSRNWLRSSCSWRAIVPVGQATSSGRRFESVARAAIEIGRATSTTARRASGSPKARVSPGSSRRSGASDRSGAPVGASGSSSGSVRAWPCCAADRSSSWRRSVTRAIEPRRDRFQTATRPRRHPPSPPTPSPPRTHPVLVIFCSAERWKRSRERNDGGNRDQRRELKRCMAASTPSAMIISTASAASTIATSSTSRWRFGIFASTWTLPTWELSGLPTPMRTRR